MVTIHRWTRALRCPHCRNEGTAALTQPEVSFDVTVESISNGFEAVQGKYGVDYRCVRLLRHSGAEIMSANGPSVTLWKLPTGRRGPLAGHSGLFPRPQPRCYPVAGR
jgi:hypothetical protein